MDVPAPPGSKVEKLLIKLGDKVSEGSPIVSMLLFDEATHRLLGCGIVGRTPATWWPKRRCHRDGG
jgi:hypothetical protein